MTPVLWDKLFKEIWRRQIDPIWEITVYTSGKKSQNGEEKIFFQIWQLSVDIFCHLFQRAETVCVAVVLKSVVFLLHVLM